MMLDAWDCIFLWVGQNARDDEKKEAERMAMVRCLYLSVTSHINCSIAFCLINIVYLTLCAFIRS